MKNSSSAIFLFALSTTACHSANWSPPEPQQNPATTAIPSATAGPAPGANAEAPAAPTPEASSAQPAEPKTAASTAPPASAESPATGTELAGPNPKGTPKEAHKSPETAAAPSEAYAGPDPCQGKTFHYAAIKAACYKGGRKAVKDIMRGVVKKAKAAGQDVQCTSCHEDTSSFRLKSNAVSDIKQWL